MGPVQHSLRYAANCSMLFSETGLVERPAAAAAAGFNAIEFWWPWPDQPVPGNREIDQFIRAVGDAGVRLIGLNFFAGDVAGQDCGVVSIPARVAEFRDNVGVAVGIGEQLGVRVFNALYGNRVDDSTPREQDELGLEALTFAAREAERIGATVLVEPVSGPKPYPLRTAADVVGVLDRVQAAGAHNVGLLCDLFHLANNGDDLDLVVDRYADRIAHVQIADWPGRGEPGTGSLDLDHYLTRIQDHGYAGYVALEYKPSRPTVDSLDWLPLARRSTSILEQD
jgi:hydroxypyruvate isomerase